MVVMMDCEWAVMMADKSADLTGALMVALKVVMSDGWKVVASEVTLVEQLVVALAALTGALMAG